MLKAFLIVSGNVQGVGYRAFACAIAKKAGICGTVKNLSNGSVEIVCECKNKEELNRFIKALFCKQGAIDVRNIESKVEKSTERVFQEFRIERE